MWRNYHDRFKFFLIVIILAPTNESLAAAKNHSSPIATWEGSMYQIECIMCSACDNPCNTPSLPPPPPSTTTTNCPPPPSPPPSSGGNYNSPPPPPDSATYYNPPPTPPYPTGPAPPPPNPIVPYFPYYYRSPPPPSSASLPPSPLSFLIRFLIYCIPLPFFN